MYLAAAQSGGPPAWMLWLAPAATLLAGVLAIGGVYLTHVLAQRREATARREDREQEARERQEDREQAARERQEDRDRAAGERTSDACDRFEDVCDALQDEFANHIIGVYADAGYGTDLSAVTATGNSWFSVDSALRKIANAARVMEPVDQQLADLAKAVHESLSAEVKVVRKAGEAANFDIEARDRHRSEWEETRKRSDQLRNEFTALAEERWKI
ncbi:hypothetical protein ABZ694_30940 [Streptomyces albidoflavus]|uniref:hypothetical protein n=1 Tax=Streptomyces albidoflavus TaxID=1886 RepID=UPI0034073124